jgi:hypothetical protein
VLTAGEDWQPVMLRVVEAGRLRVRNAHAGRRGSLAVRAAILRAAA